MELGERLRQARLEAGLSQRQLCGEEITRNMLSQIENGSARPSMDTLRYLAARLGKSVSYFLEEQAVTSPNQETMATARRAYGAGDARQCLGALEGYREPDTVFDGERWLLAALAEMELAKAAMAEGKPAYAAALLERAGEAGKRSAYFTEALERQRLLLRYEAEPEAAKLIAAALPDNTPELLLRAAAAETPEQRAALLDAVQGPRDPRWQLLRGEACYAMGDFQGAIALFREAEESCPKQAVPKLEACYHALRDFEMAYHYAIRQRELGL